MHGPGVHQKKKRMCRLIIPMEKEVEVNCLQCRLRKRVILEHSNKDRGAVAVRCLDIRMRWL